MDAAETVLAVEAVEHVEACGRRWRLVEAGEDAGETFGDLCLTCSGSV